jgi:DNA-binding transcriptional ArsR family regulator
MDSNLVVRALSALAHDSRLAIFRALVVPGPEGMAAGEIAQRLGISPSSLSFHLKDLSHAELVKPRQAGPIFPTAVETHHEAYAIWPGEPMTAHWGFEDPAAFEGRTRGGHGNQPVRFSFRCSASHGCWRSH